MQNVAVIICGCHLGAMDWERIMYGDPKKGLLGRCPKALKLALDLDAKRLIFGTGASYTHEDVSEAHATLSLIQRHIPDLATDFPKEFADYSTEDLLAFLDKIAVTDTIAVNTRTEIERGVSYALLGKCDRLVIVTSPTHASRAIRDACVVTEKVVIDIQLHVSDTNYRDMSAADVAVVEPPHRGDDPTRQYKYPLHILVGRMFKIRYAAREDFQADLNWLLKKYSV